MSGGKSKSKTSQDTQVTDSRVGASDSAIAVGANSVIDIEALDPGIIDFGSEILAFSGSLVDLADASAARAAEINARSIDFAADQVKPTTARTTQLLTTVSVVAVAAWAISKGLK